MMNQRKPDALDIAVGQRIRVERLARRMSQTELAERIGVSFQQVQKYEKGVNRVGASRLQQIANVLKVAPDFFFDGASAKAVTDVSKEITLLEGFISSRDGVALSKAFTKISHQKMRRSIVSLVEQIARV